MEPRPVPEHEHPSHSHWFLWFCLFVVANGGYDCRGIGGRVEKLEAKVQQLEARDAPGPWIDCGPVAPALSAKPQPEIVEGFEIVAP